MSYTSDNPKWVKAERVTNAGPGLVTVTAYGETFERCAVEWNDPVRNKEKSDVLVQNSRGDWLRVWFWDRDVV